MENIKVKNTINYYGLKDTIINEFNEVFQAINNNSAIRSIKMTASQNQQLMAYKNDLQLFKLGHFDKETGEFTNDLVNLGFIAQYIEELKNEEK